LVANILEVVEIIGYTEYIQHNINYGLISNNNNNNNTFFGRKN
jgi:hypothetical protein